MELLKLDLDTAKEKLKKIRLENILLQNKVEKATKEKAKCQREDQQVDLVQQAYDSAMANDTVGNEAYATLADNVPQEIYIWVQNPNNPLLGQAISHK